MTEYHRKLEQENAALKAALEPFADAWERRRPAVTPDKPEVYNRRMFKALQPFYSNGDADNEGTLTGEHLRRAFLLLGRKET